MSSQPTNPSSEQPKKPAPVKPPFTPQADRMPYLDVEWGDAKFVQIQYTSVIDLIYKDNIFVITSSRYQIKFLVEEGGTAFDLAKFRKEFQAGRVTNLTARPDLGVSIRVYELTKKGPVEL